jgi:hypothetical protein
MNGIFKPTHRDKLFNAIGNKMNTYYIDEKCIDNETKKVNQSYYININSMINTVNKIRNEKNLS